MSSGTEKKIRRRGVIGLVYCVLSCHIAYKHISPHLFVQQRKERAYKDLPLNDEKKEIRVLRLHPGYPWSTIRCELRVASLEPSDVPKYMALSYTWNEPIQPSAPLTSFRGIRQHFRGLYQHYLFPSHATIFINDSRFPITRNLSTALRHLRVDNEPLDLWIDAICINQDNNAEKGQQVQMMPDIYSKAKMTCVWLGPSADGSDEAVDFINSANKLDVSNASLPDTIELVPTKALVALYSRTWWQRVWVIQEALLSNRTLVMCGTKGMPFYKFEVLLRKERTLMTRVTASRAAQTGGLESRSVRTWNFIPPTLPFFGLIELGPWLRRVRKSHEPLKQDDIAAVLATLVRLTWRFQSTLPRDKVNALLGIVPEVQAYLSVTYGPEKSDGEVFKDLSVYLMKWTNSLDAIIEWRKIGGGLVDAPSWAINYPLVAKGSQWATPTPYDRKYEADGGFRTWLRLTPLDVMRPYKPEPFPDNGGFLKHSIEIITESINSLWQEQYGVNPKFSSDTNTLHLHGLVFDTVTAVCQPSSKTWAMQINYIDDPISRKWFSGVWFGLVHHHRIRQIVLGWKSFLDANTKTTPDPYQDPDHQGGRKVEFWRAIIADSVLESSGAFGKPDARFMDIVSQGFPGDTRPYTWEYWIPPIEVSGEDVNKCFRRFSAEFLKGSSSRSLIVSKKGYIGLAPMDVKSGDVICVIRGYHMPVVLRPVEAKEGVYLLVGNSYVHGIMDGGFAQTASRRDVKKFQIE